MSLQVLQDLCLVVHWHNNLLPCCPSTYTGKFKPRPRLDGLQGLHGLVRRGEECQLALTGSFE